VGFTINHVAAVVAPVVFGVLGMVNPAIIFWLGAGVASISLVCSFLVPHRPSAGNETVFSTGVLPGDAADELSLASHELSPKASKP
jgi:hypothetical protein